MKKTVVNKNRNDEGSEPDKDQNQLYLKRDRKEPKYLKDYVTDCDDSDVASKSV